MEWPDLKFWLSWYVILPNLLYLVAFPFILCYFFCRFGRISFRWGYGMGYVLLVIGQTALEEGAGMPGSLSLLLEAALFTLYGVFLLKIPWQEAWMDALLLRSVFGIIDSVVKWADYRIFLPFFLKQEAVFFSADFFRELIKAALVICFLTLILRRFYRSTEGPGRETLLLLTVPLFFIALVERVLQESFYGDTFIVDTASGLVLPEVSVSHGENLVLQILAGICLLAILLIYQKLVHMRLTEKKLYCLEQQAAEQKRYLEEAFSRETRTKAFRHDLTNHLTVLKELLATGQTERAYGYLSQLDETAKAFTCDVRTGNPAVDVLLASKYMAAEQKGIRVRCELFIPEGSGVKDIDWCVILSNAFDNAVNACEKIPREKRYVSLSGKRKGNFYLLFLENSCSEGIREVPPEGTGLSNIRTVLESMEGTMEKTVSGGVYRLKLLFVLPQRENSSLRQSVDSGKNRGDK